MTVEQLSQLLELTATQIELLYAIEQQHQQLTDDVFASDLTGRQMMRKIRTLSQRRHQQICQMLTQPQQHLYKELAVKAHDQARQILLHEA